MPSDHVVNDYDQDTSFQLGEPPSEVHNNAAEEVDHEGTAYDSFILV